MGHGIHQVQAEFLLLLASVVLFAEIARRLRIAYPIVLVLGGLALSFVPGLPRITLEPDLVFAIILPPLLYHAAWMMSWREFRRGLLSISMLAFGLTAFTVVGIAFAGERLFSMLYWKTGLVLGAIVAPTDAIAASSIAKRLGLPRSITDLLEGESLINDATGLLAVQIGVALVAKDLQPTWHGVLGDLAFLVIVGTTIGLAIGFIAAWLSRRIDDGPITMALSLLTPYVAYLAAESVHSSGVLAVVACGLYLSRQSARAMMPVVRLQLAAVWEGFDFLLNGFVFAMIGLQLPTVLAGLEQYSTKLLIEDALAFAGILIALRLLFVVPGAYALFGLKRLFGIPAKKPSGRVAFIVGWTGMRGVISLAAALSLPLTIFGDQPFPARNLILFLTFCTILVTLVLQGLTLPPLIRMLGLSGEDEHEAEEREARRAMLIAAVERVAQLRAGDDEEHEMLYADIERRLQTDLTDVYREDLTGPRTAAKRAELMDAITRAERETAVQMRDQGRINDEILRKLERELDLRVARALQ